MTGWTFPQIAEMTVTQLQLVLEGQGPILFPRLRPQLDASWGNVSDEEVQNILKDAPPKDEQKAKDRAAAYRKHYAFYLGETETPSLLPQAQPIPGLPPETARAIVAFAEGGGFDDATWADFVAPIWRELQATAKAPA